MIAATRKREAELDVSVRGLEADMIKTMGNYGLKVNELTAEQEQLWFDESGRVVPGLVGKLYDRNIYGRIQAILQNHRGGRR